MPAREQARRAYHSRVGPFYGILCSQIRSDKRSIMKVRVEVFRWLVICEAAVASVSPCAYCQNEPRATATAKVMVWVRDGRGAPVSGLTTDDFVVTENGVRDRVIAVTNFSGAAVKQSPTDRAVLPLSSHQGQRVTDLAPSNGEPVPELATHVLLIITPMMPTGRAHALHDAIRFLGRPGFGTLADCFAGRRGRICA